ncbi:MAG: hypothetical protein MO852_11345 [Candidatus Devosia euplotis]|nr:hypothetical protein [Candidatus Devosia euplotis]
MQVAAFFNFDILFEMTLLLSPVAEWLQRIEVMGYQPIATSGWKGGRAAIAQSKQKRICDRQAAPMALVDAW